MSQKIAYIFTGGRKNRIPTIAKGESPEDFFYGALELERRGHSVTIFEAVDFPAPLKTGKHWAILGWLLRWLFGLDLPALQRLNQARVLEELNKFEAIIVADNSNGLALAYLRWRKKLYTPVIFLSMCPLFPEDHFIKKAFYGRLLSAVILGIENTHEIEFLQEIYPRRDLIKEYTPFGVDLDFWQPSRKAATPDYVLSMGNDEMRDFEILLRAWKPEYPLLKLITRRQFTLPLPANVELIHGDWRNQALSDVRIRQYIQESLFVVVPSKETLRSSGPSVSMQAMACQRAVILSETKGLWAPQYLTDNLNCLLVKPGDSKSLQEKIEQLLSNEALRKQIALAGRKIAEQHFTVSYVANRIENLLLFTKPASQRRQRVLFIYRGHFSIMLLSRLSLEKDTRTDFLYGYSNLDKNKYDSRYVIAPRGERLSLFGVVALIFEWPVAKILRLGFAIDIYLRFRKQIKQADILVCVNDSIALGILFWKKLGLIKSKTVVIFQALSERIEVFRPHSIIKGFLGALTKEADHIFVLSQLASLPLIKELNISGKRISVFKFGINPNFWQPRKAIKPRKIKKIISVGNDSHRDYETLIAAIDFNQELVLVTKRRLKGKLRGKNVKILSGITNSELRALYQTADCAVIPNGKVQYESSGLSSILHAMAAGLPTIISDAPPLRELFTDQENCLFYEPGNIESLKEKLRWLDMYPEAAARLAKNAEELVRNKFTNQRMSRQLTEIFEKLTKL